MRLRPLEIFHSVGLPHLIHRRQILTSIKEVVAQCWLSAGIDVRFWIINEGTIMNSKYKNK